MAEPLWFRWNGAAMLPMRPDAASRQFIVDQRYLLEAHHERSHARHRAYFAALNQAWQNLAADDFPTAEHLRKFALIKTGWRDERILNGGNHMNAERIAAFCRPLDSYAVITTDGPLVRIWTAKSQSYKSMAREDFTQSMEDVLAYCASLIGVPVEELKAEGEMA